MLLRDVMYYLETGELKNLSIVDEATNQIKPDQYGRVVSSLNLAMNDLHTRLLLKKGTCRVELKEDQVVYPLTQRFVHDPKKPKDEQFITTSETMSSLVKILEVRDEHGQILPLNNGDPRRGVETPNFSTLVVSSEILKEYGSKYLTVEFQKKARNIDNYDREFDPDIELVDVEPQFMNALCLFIASRLHNPVGFGTGGVHEGNNYHSLYLEECARLQNTGQQIVETFYGSHKQRKGFP